MGPLRVALTGGIASGKSVCLERFCALGAPVVDADLLARDAVRPGSPGLSAVVRQFGPEFAAPDGSLRRDALARLVFRDPAARAALEAIVHPLVYAAIEAWFDEQRGASAPIAIADVPLLYETGRDRDFDCVIVAACSPQTQTARVMARDGLSATEAAERLAAQWPIDTKTVRADYVIDTNGTLDDTFRGVDAVWALLRERAAVANRL